MVGLLAMNLWVSSQALQPNQPVRIPYSPTFLDQVRNGNVNEISSTGDAIQGTFKTAIRYPPTTPPPHDDELSPPRSRRSPTTRS